MRKMNFEDKSGKKKFIGMLLDGGIIEKLDDDFPLMRVQSIEEYMEYITECWQKYANNSFALYKGYRLDIVCTGVLAQESIENALLPHLKLNDKFGFRLVDTRAEEVLKVETYEQLKRILSAERE